MKILSEETARLYQNTSLQRGRIVFTSFISYNRKILFLAAHIERLVKGAEFLFPNLGWSDSAHLIKEYVEEVFARASNQQNNDLYFRVTIFDDCLYIQQGPLNTQSVSLKLTFAFKVKTASLLPAFVKLSNYLDSDLELAKAKILSFNDVLFLDNENNVTEASTSNVFIVNNEGKIITPKPSSNILEGVTRIMLLEKLRSHEFNIIEAPISKLELQCAKEIWLTNSVKGVRFVQQFENRIFDKKDSLFLKAIAVFGRLGELV